MARRRPWGDSSRRGRILGRVWIGISRREVGLETGVRRVVGSVEPFLVLRRLHRLHQFLGRG
eukprot:510193-Pyramimonas_sp.AAC.1